MLKKRECDRLEHGASKVKGVASSVHDLRANRM
jgi:hypothetical protein